MFLALGFAIGDETGLEGRGKTGLCFGRKVRVKGIQTEKLVLLKLSNNRNTSEYLSIAESCRDTEQPSLLSRVFHIFSFIK